VSLHNNSIVESSNLNSDLDQLSDDFPEDYFKMKILPELLKSVEFGGGGPKVFGVVMKISKKLTDEEFEIKVTPAVVRLFSSPDRAIRVCLLDNLPLMIDRLPQKVVNDKIFPQMVLLFFQTSTIADKIKGYWLYRYCTCSKRADCQVCTHNHRKIIGQDHQW
jgi:SCY1-like protein 1